MTTPIDALRQALDGYDDADEHVSVSMSAGEWRRVIAALAQPAAERAQEPYVGDEASKGEYASESLLPMTTHAAYDMPTSCAVVDYSKSKTLNFGQMSVGAQLAAESDALDAKRYRWLRDQSAEHICRAISAKAQDGDGIKVTHEWAGHSIKPRMVLSGASMDAAIDAAMREKA